MQHRTPTPPSLPHAPSRGPFSPTATFALVLLTVFVAEGLIMLALPRLSRWPAGSLGESILDASLLTVLVAPTLWIVIVRPLRRLYRERGVLLATQFEREERERARLGRELHDELGQQLTALTVGLRVMVQATSDPDARQRAAALHEQAGASLASMRRIASGLGPSVLEQLGLATAVERLCDDFRASHAVALDSQIDVPPGRRFDAAAELAAYRVVQEALTNIARHARATSGSVRLGVGDAGLEIEVRDDGRGLGERSDARAHATLGLAGMRERVELLGGTFGVESSPGAGTRVVAAIPDRSTPTPPDTGGPHA